MKDTWLNAAISCMAMLLLLVIFWILGVMTL